MQVAIAMSIAETIEDQYGIPDKEDKFKYTDKVKETYKKLVAQNRVGLNNNLDAAKQQKSYPLLSLLNENADYL